MIKSKKGRCVFKGTGAQLMADYFVIGKELRKVLPTEIVDHAVELSRLTKQELIERMENKNGRN